MEGFIESSDFEKRLKGKLVMARSLAGAEM